MKLSTIKKESTVYVQVPKRYLPDLTNLKTVNSLYPLPQQYDDHTGGEHR